MTFLTIKIRVSHKVQLILSFHVRAMFEMDGSSFSLMIRFFFFLTGKEMYKKYKVSV